MPEMYADIERSCLREEKADYFTQKFSEGKRVCGWHVSWHIMYKHPIQFERKKGQRNWKRWKPEAVRDEADGSILDTADRESIDEAGRSIHGIDHTLKGPGPQPFEVTVPDAPPSVLPNVHGSAKHGC